MTAHWNARSDHRYAVQDSTGSGRRAWAGTVLMLAATLAVALASYSVSMTVSAERASVDRLARENAAIARELKSLEAEYRVRMRLPQLERWNREVLGLRPINADQFLGNPLLLASYGNAPKAAVTAPILLEPKLAVVRDNAAVAARDGPRLHKVADVREAAPAPDAANIIDPELLAAVAALADPSAADMQGSHPGLTQVALDTGATGPVVRQ